MNDNLSIDQKLAQCLGPEWISSRSGFGGTKVMYLEGKTAINLANEIFGYNGWSSEIKNSVVDFMDTTDDGRVSLGIATTVRVTLKDGTYHEDTGYGLAENAKGKAAAFEKARKESATDALKRAIRMFGNATGNCIYDKTYLRNIVNMGRPSAPFIPFDLYRQEHIRKVIRAEMESSTGPAISPATRPSVQVKQEQQQQKTPPAPAMNPVPAPVVKSTPVASTTTHTSIPTPIKSEPEKNTPDETIAPTKRALEDDVFAEDSFMIDDEDVAFYAEIIETEVDDKVDIELLEQVMQNNRDPPGDPSTKRQRQ